MHMHVHGMQRLILRLVPCPICTCGVHLAREKYRLVTLVGWNLQGSGLGSGLVWGVVWLGSSESRFR